MDVEKNMKTQCTAGGAQMNSSAGNKKGYEARLEEYLNGSLEPGQFQEIESDIEKFRALMGYMDRTLDEELFEAEEGKEKAKEGKAEGDKTIENKISRRLSRAVNRKFRNYAIAAAAIAVSIVFLLLVTLSPLLDTICYNPSATLEIVNEEDNSVMVISPFAMQMSVYMELFCGDKGFAESSAWPEGYGRYTISIRTQIDGVTEPHMLELVRNHLYRSDMNWNRSDFPDNAFTYKYGESSCSIKKEEALEKLAGMPDQIKIRTAVSFKDIKSMEELIEFMEQNETYYLYCPIEADCGSFLGFSPKYTGISMKDCYDKEKYPYLDIFEYEEEEEITLAEAYEKHVESMIKYLMDNEDFLRIFDSGVPGENVLDSYKYNAILDYIKRRGVECYGTVVYASRQELERILESPEVDGIYMLDGRLDMN